MRPRYSSPVSELLSFGDCRELREWPDYSGFGLGREHVPELIDLATDEELGRADPESLEVWAPVHAWRALGQLRAKEAVEPLFVLLGTEDDWAHEELPVVYGMIGRDAIPSLSRYLGDTSYDLYSRVGAAHGIEQVAAIYPSTRGESLSALSRQMERFTENKPELNGFLVAYLLDLHAIEKISLMQRAFAADSVDPTIAGDWEDVQVELGLKEARETPRPPLSPMFGMPGPEENRQARATGKSATKKKKSKKKQAKASRKQNRKRR